MGLCLNRPIFHGLMPYKNAKRGNTIMKTFALDYSVNGELRTEFVQGNYMGNVWATKTAHVLELEKAGYVVKYVDIVEI